MSLQVEKLEKNMAKLTIEATAEEFEAAMKELDKKYVEVDAERRRIREEHEKELAERRRARNEARRLAAPHNN